MQDSPIQPPVAIDTGDNRSGACAKDILKKGIGFLISLIALGVVAFSVEWSRVGKALAEMHYWALAPAVTLIALQMYLRGVRWRYLLPSDRSVSTRTLVDSIMVGNLASSLLPLRAGEFVRPLLLSLQSSYSFPTGFVSVVIERFFDLSAVLISFGIVSLLVKDIPAWVVQGASALSVLAAGLLIFIALGALLPALIKRVTFFGLSIFPVKIRVPLENFSLNLLEGATVLRAPSRLFGVLFYSLIVWLVTFASYYSFFWLFDMPPSFMQAVVITVFIALAVAAPSAPGFIGVYQIGCIAAFTLFAVPIELATAYALISHLIQYVTTIVYGGYALSRTEWSLADLTKRRPIAEK